MRLIDADAFEAELNERLLPILIERYGRDEALRGLHFSFRDCICNIQTQPTIEPEQGEWIEQGKQMVINLANAREQYSTLGYPHRNILSLQCSECRMLTLVDESILYDFCPHCGAKMEVKDERD